MPDFPTAPHASSHGGAGGDAVEKSASGASFGQLKDQEEKASTGQRRSAATTGSDEKLKLIRELS